MGARKKNMGLTVLLVGVVLLSLVCVTGTAGAQQDDPQEPLCWADYGDLPDGYPVTYGEGGPYHYEGCVRLGTVFDAEGTGVHDPSALGDDGAGVPDDEDGIIGDPLAGGGAIGSPVNLLVTITDVCNVPPSSGGYLYAWFDWNNDGDLDDPGERMDFGLLGPGENIALPEFSIPDTREGTGLCARFRLYEADPSNPGPKYGVTGGEVEDYCWDQPSAVTISSFSGETQPVSYALAIPVLLLLLGGLLGLRRFASRKV